MTGDARFRDADPSKPLRLWATDADDLKVIAALCQDAVLPAHEMLWDQSARSFALLLNRFRWEDRRSPERVQSVMTIGDVRRVQSQGVTRDKDVVLSLLTIAWQAAEDGTGALELTFAGDGALRLEVECLDLRLHDVTRPYTAPSRRQPEHPA